MIRHTISMPETMSRHVMDLERRKAAQQQMAILQLKALIEAGKASGIGSKSMAEIKAEACAELGTLT